MQRILTFSFYLLFFLTPLLWAPWNFELFEYNKMVFVYFLTLIITATWLIKMVGAKNLIFKTTPLDIPLLLFLGANILSTIFSIDRHTSIWGYYSRSNGGLLSLISYLLLYWALVSNFGKEEILKFLRAALFGGFLVSLWAIPEHFGVSPSCLILTGKASASCWVQDVQARVFATLGQPNWLAAYLVMLIFPAFYFLLTATKKSLYILHFTLLIIFYLALTFTYSRGATLGFLAGLIIFLVLQVLAFHLEGGRLKSISLVLASFLIINILFGSALTDFKLVSKFAAPERPAVSLTQTGTQLEAGGTESGKIRLIVWQGAWEIFKHYPIFGSGLETFAYSYYQYRPATHNLVSEWDFLYNKAHNEFLNYLATTGIVGFLSYLGVILTFIIWSAKKIYQGKNNFTLYPSASLRAGILYSTLLASYASYLVQNFFGFSVVVTALLFFLIPALAFIATDSTKPLKLSKQLDAKRYTLYAILYRPLYPKLIQIIILIFSGLLFFILAKNYWADIFYAQGSRLADANPGRAYNNLSEATVLNPGEPLYQSELAFAAASASLTLSDTDATASFKLKNRAVLETETILKNHPKNVPFFRTAIRTYYLLSTLDPIYQQKTLQTFDQTISLAPTDAKLFYNKATVLEAAGKKQEAIEVLEQALKLKPNYVDALDALEKLKAQ